MMSSALRIFIALYIFSTISALPQPQNSIRTVRKIQDHTYRRQHANNEKIYFPNGVQNSVYFRTRDGSSDDYDDVETVPLDFKPVHSISSLDRKPPGVDRTLYDIMPQQPTDNARRMPPAQRPQEKNPADFPETINRDQHRYASDICVKAMVKCCQLYAYHNMAMPRCFEQLGCAGGYYDGPCSRDMVNKVRNHLKKRN